ncbi:MAG: twin-arginine translocase TatA/TatE family subunit [Opitutaceae bacterium]|nr:twin-arginine translocase TatA/TatE family subunit [Opitutaceae bacterium]
MRPMLPSLAFLDVGGTELLMIMLVTLLLFGSKRMPELARGLGKSIREFKKATSGLEEELKRAIEAPPPPPPKPASPCGKESTTKIPPPASSGGPPPPPPPGEQPFTYP